MVLLAPQCPSSDFHGPSFEEDRERERGREGGEEGEEKEGKSRDKGQREVCCRGSLMKYDACRVELLVLNSVVNFLHVMSYTCDSVGESFLGLSFQWYTRSEGARGRERERERERERQRG